MESYYLFTLYQNDKSNNKSSCSYILPITSLNDNQLEALKKYKESKLISHYVVQYEQDFWSFFIELNPKILPYSQNIELLKMRSLRNISNILGVIIKDRFDIFNQK